MFRFFIASISALIASLSVNALMIEVFVIFIQEGSMGIIDEMSVSSFGMKFIWMRYVFDFVDAVLFFIELAEFLIVRPLILLIII